jgi:alpha-galactosidase
MRFACSLFVLLLAAPLFAADKEKPLVVFILAGQSNMEGKAKVSLLEYQIEQPGTREQFAHLRGKDGKWVEREDVWIKFLDRKGKLTVGFGSPNCIGPELEFGNAVGNQYDQQVLLIKTAWGGRSLYRDFRPPSAGLPEEDVLAKMLANAQKNKPETTIDDIKALFGKSYREMLTEVKTTLADIKKVYPDYKDQGYELGGFAWFQGWNDMIDAAATAEYADNLVHFIQDVRKDLDAPKLPFVIGQMGVDGEKANANVQKFKDAQAKAAAAFKPEDKVALVKTDVYWDTAAQKVFDKGWRENKAEWDTVGSDYPYHYLGSVKTMSGIGKGLAEAMMELRK